MLIPCTCIAKLIVLQFIWIVLSVIVAPWKSWSGIEELENSRGDWIQLVLLRRHYFQASLSDYNNLKYETFLVAAVKMLIYGSLNSCKFLWPESFIICISEMLELARDVIIVFQTEWLVFFPFRAPSEAIIFMSCLIMSLPILWFLYHFDPGLGM